MKNLFFLVLVLLAIGVGAWFFNQKYLTQTSDKPTQITNSDTVISGKILAQIKTGTRTDIISFNTDSKNKVLFTDQDEKQKISKVASINSGDKVLPVIMGDQLFKIWLDGSGKKELLQSSFGAQDFGFSPDGKKIATISFSNAEKNYGYSLSISSIDGSTTKELVHSSDIIRELAWLDNSTIIYIQDKGETVTILARVNIDSGKTQVIYTTDQEIYNFNLNHDKIVLSQGGNGPTKSSILKIDLNGKNSETLYSDTSGIIYYPYISPDGTKVVFLVSADVSDKPSGQMFLYDLKTKNKTSISQANKIIAWIN